MPINPIAAKYVAAYVGGQLLGVALATAIVKKATPALAERSYARTTEPFDLSKQLGDDWKFKL